MPIRGRRWLVEIPEITRDFGTSGSPDVRPIIVKMKRGIAEYFDLTQIPSDDPRLRGTFSGTGSNAGKTFQKRIGGFREDSYMFIADGKFSITEHYYDANDNPVSAVGEFKTFSIGFPKGTSVNELVDWIKATGKDPDIDFIVSPAGVQTHIYFAAETPAV